MKKQEIKRRDIPRKFMPSINAKDLKGRYEFVECSIPLNELRPVQSERKTGNTERQVRRIKEGKVKPIVLDSEFYIVNGHHRYDAFTLLEYTDVPVLIVKAKLHELMEDFSKGLRVNHEMLRQARGNKMHFVVYMKPEKFIEVTTSEGKAPSRSDILDRCHTLDKYNQFSDDNEIIHMPFLYIADTQIIGHEGRHRAGSLICAGIDKMPVSIRLRPDYGNEEWLKAMYDKYGHRYEYEMSFEDMPEQVRGEFGRGTLSRSDMELYIDGWDNIR